MNATQEAEKAASRLQSLLFSHIRDDYPYLKSAVLEQLTTHIRDEIKTTLVEQQAVMTASKCHMNILTVPPEIRNRIFKFICPQIAVELRERERTRVESCGSGMMYNEGDMAHQPKMDATSKAMMVVPAIGHTCRQLRQEILPIFYGNTSFAVYMTNKELQESHWTKKDVLPIDIRNWAETIGKYAKNNLVRSIVVKVPLIASPFYQYRTKKLSAQGNESQKAPSHIRNYQAAFPEADIYVQIGRVHKRRAIYTPLTSYDSLASKNCAAPTGSA